MKALILGRVIDPFQKIKILDSNEYMRKTDHFGGFIRAFESLNIDVEISWRVRFLYNGKFQQLFPYLFRILDFFIKNSFFIKKIDRFFLSISLARFCKKNNIDFIFTELNGSISPNLIKKYYPGIVTTQWMGVFPDQIHKSVSEVFPEYDVLWCPCVFDDTKVKFDGMDKLFYVGSGYDPKTHYYEYDKNYSYDIAFYGGIDKSHSERKEVLEFIADKYDNFAIFGYGITNVAKDSHIRKVFRGWLEPDEIRKLISSSKIIINLTLDRYDFIKKGFNARLFEVAACNGAVQILKDDNKIYDYFKKDNEVVVYSDLTELKEKIDSLLLSNFRRNEISKNASLRVANFTFKRKAKMMLKKINDIANKNYV